jgi:hypothetical protein
MSPGRWVRGSSRVVAGLVALASIGLTACGDDGNQPADAAIDAVIDAPPACVPLTGEVIDWDSSSATFCGVFGAKVTARGAPTVTDTTNPNGRFELCVARQAQTVLDVVFSANPSECATPSEIYPGPAVFVADQAVVDASTLLTARAMMTMRQAAMFTQAGTTYSAAQAQLIVHVIGAASPVTISTAHATAQAYDGTTWAAGSAGSDVFFPNAAPGATQVSVASKVFNVTLEPGVFTYLTVSSAVTAAAR